ncbi:MAG: hypothetical protein ABI967_07870 [bacterium]
MPIKKDRKTAPKKVGAKSAERSQRAAKKSQSKKPNRAAAAETSQASTTAERAVFKATDRIAELGRVWEWIAQFVKPVEFRVSCVRPDDLLVCDFIFENLRLETQGNGAPKLIRINPAAAAHLIVELPPQSFGEEAFLDATGESVPGNLNGAEKFPDKDSPPGLNPKNVVPPGDAADPLPAMPSARIRMAGRSRIAFSMPAVETDLSFKIETILDACRRWPMRLDINAVPDPPRTRARRSKTPTKDSWLSDVVMSLDWARATETLLAGLGGDAIQKPLAAAARRIAKKTIDAIASGSPRSVEGQLRKAFDEELDVLGTQFPPLRDPIRHEIGAAALSLMTTKEVAGYHLVGTVLDIGKELPFLPVIFGPHKPAQNVTALELPYRLILSPVPQSYWHHSTKAVSRNGRTELWHTRLTGGSAFTGPDLPTNVRALWSDDYHMPGIVGIVNSLLPFRMSLDPLDREMLVKLMSGFDEVDPHEHVFHPHTAKALRLSLSSLGALLDAEGNWAPPAPKKVSLEEWRHLATLGRDHYVRVVYRGFLKDFRHAASLVKVTERKFETLPGSTNRVAVLRQRFFIIVREPIKHYDGKGHKNQGRDFPFTDVEILTRITPSLVAPDKPECRLSDPDNVIYNAATGVPHRACFWPMITAANNFMFQIAATDLSGNRVTFAMPLLFVGIEANEDPVVRAEVIKQNNKELANVRRRAMIDSKSVCYAPQKAGAKGDPRMPTASITFKADPVDPNAVSIDEAQFYPVIEEASVSIPSIQRLLQKDAPITVEYAKIYKDTANGFGFGNAGELFLKLKGSMPLEFGSGNNQPKSDALGGLATPSMEILGLSRQMGPVAAQGGGGDPEAKLGDIIGNKFNPAAFFKGAKILGGIGFEELLDLIPGLEQPSVPKLLSRETADKIEASFDWSTQINHSDAAKGMFIPNAGGPTLMEMHGVVSAPLMTPSAKTFSATASLVNFKVNLFGFVTLWFDRLEFTAKSGAKPDVAVDLHAGEEAVAFGGPLEFVNEIRKIIPSNGFSDPPSLSVTPSGISASYSINIPSLAVGIFALEHLSLGAGFVLPFDAKPAEVRFNFGERQRPFSLTVSLLGGGGFLAIGIGSEGVREIEAALEFGAALSINLGVASGSVEIKAGIYFHWMTESVELAGYVRLHGELSVLGLISASLTFNLQLAYMKDNTRSVVWGEATLEVEIDILFLSFSVSVSCRREFGGSDGDPKFIQLIPDQNTWDNYCEAFATEAA